MPQVPIYDGPQARTQALQPVMRQAPDVSSGARALAQGLAQVADVADRRAEQQAQDEAFKIEGQLREGWQKQRAALRNQYKGEQADEYAAKASEWWEASREQYLAAASPMVRNRVGKALGQFKLQADADTLGYVEGEKKRTREVNYRVLQQSLVGDFMSKVTPGNATALGEEVSARLTENAIKHATAEGLDGAVVGKQLAREQLDKMHTSVALALAGRPGGADAARQYLAKFGESMDLADRTRVLDLVDVEAEKTKTKAVRDATGALMLNIERGQFPKKAEIDLLAAADPTAAAQVQRAMNAEIKARKVEAKGETVKTDWAVYENVRTRLMAGEKVAVAEYRDKLAPGEIEKLIDLKTKKDDPKKAPEVATTEQQMGAYTRRMDLKGEKLGQFQSAAYDRFNMHLKATGKEPDLDQREAILDQLAKEVVTNPGFFWDSKGPAYTLPKEQRDKLAPLATDKFTVGTIYRDSKTGARAKYLGGGKWEPAP